MNLIVQDEKGIPVASLSDYQLDLQYGSGKDYDCDFVLSAPGLALKSQWRILADGTPFGGMVTHRCPSSTADGDSIYYKGRTIQGILKDHCIEPPRGSSHRVAAGEANGIIADVVESVGLQGFLEVDPLPSGIVVPSYSFNRYVDAWTGLCMMLSRCGARLEVACKDGGHIVRAVGNRAYGSAQSERLYFELEMDELPYNHIIGLGKGEGAAREVVHWYADLLGSVSANQSLFGLLERTYVYALNSEEGSALSSKTRSKLEELQLGSEATLTLPPGVSLDVGDRVTLSNARFNVEADAEVTAVVVKASTGVCDVQYEFGTPDFPADEE